MPELQQRIAIALDKLGQDRVRSLIDDTDPETLAAAIVEQMDEDEESDDPTGDLLVRLFWGYNTVAEVDGKARVVGRPQNGY